MKWVSILMSSLHIRFKLAMVNGQIGHTQLILVELYYYKSRHVIGYLHGLIQC